MQEDSTEELARSQLETLYRLGILERSPEDEEQSRSRSSESGLNHEAFLAALPPPSVEYPLPPRMLQTWSDNSDSGGVSDSIQSGEFYVDNRSDGGSRILEIPRRRSRLKTRRSISSRMSEAAQASARDSRALRMWFRQWKIFVRGRRERDRRRAKADVFLKQSALTKWACFLKQRRDEHDKKRILDAWKVARALSRWNQWKQRCCRLRSLLNGGRSSLLGRLMLQRIWRRWITFTKRRKYVQSALTQRTLSLHHRLVRSAWTELRIHTFRARQDCLARRRCLGRMRQYCAIQEQQRRTCTQLQHKVLLGRKCDILHRWRAFAHASSRDKRLVRRVRFDVRRRRYFLLWCDVARTVSDVVHLRARISRRELYEHFAAWKVTARALQMGERVRKTREKHLRSIYFAAFRDQAQFSAFCHQATVVLTHRRLAAAVRFLHTWAADRRRGKDGVYRIQETRRTRLLQRVWSTGWRRIHRKRLAVHHCNRSLTVRYFNAWKQFHRKQQAYYVQQERAEARHCKLCCRQSLAGWKAYYKERRERAQQLLEAQKHHRRRLIQRGVGGLWDAVYQNTQHSLRAHHLRQNLRTSLKKRHFRAWQALVHSRKEVEERVHRLQHSPGYQKSICNPSRRAWGRWVLYVCTCRQRSRCDQHFQLRMKRKVLLDWHRQASLEARFRAFNSHARRSKLELCFGVWKSRVEKWKKVDAICNLAERVHERKLCTRVVRAWRCWSAYHRRAYLGGETVRCQREEKLQQTGFSEWRNKFNVRRCFLKVKHTRRRQLLRKCFTSWCRDSMRQKAFTRKLTYFYQVYGKYPASSIVSRSWRRWQHRLNQGRYVKALHRRHRLKQAKQCWSHWKVFHAACQILRAWHRAAQATASCTNRLGMRLRSFRDLQHRRVQERLMDEWKTLVDQRRRLQEMQSLLKHKLNREVEAAKWRVEQAAQLRLSSWLRRWKIAHSKSSNLARNYYHTGLLQKSVLSWWKTTIHSKQEKVLMEAQQTIGKLSYYHPQQQVYMAQARRTDHQKKERKLPKRKAKVASKDVSSARVESLQKMRRMLDPTEYASYSRFYQESGKEVSPVRGKTRTAQRLPASRASDPAGSQSSSDLELHRRTHDAHSSRDEKTQREDYGARDKVSDRGIATKSHWGQPDAIQSIRGVSSTAVRDAVSDQNLSIADVSCDQISVQPADLRCNSESRGYFRQDHRCASPESSDGLLSRSTKVPLKELPLFDDDVSIEVGNLNDGARMAASSPPICWVPEPRHNPNFHHKSSFEPEGSTLESPRAMHRRSLDPPALIVNARDPYEYEAHPAATPTMFEPTESLEPASETNSADRQRKPRVTKSRSTAHRKRIKVVSSSNNDARPLADILQLTDGFDSKVAGSIDGHADADAQWNNDPADDLSALKEIANFYAACIVAQTGNNGFHDGEAELRTTRIRVCFRMARDLALFQNDFYIDELLRVYDASFKGSLVGLDANKREERMRLEQFLEQLVENHPAYRKYVDLSLRRNYPQSPVPLSALSWLAQQHLRPHILQQRGARARPKRSPTYWIWEPMPAEMDMALEKLLPAITKYMRVLGQFFLRQAVQSSSPLSKAKDYRMSSAAFIALMKQVHVFPQLFHRRELENAVQMSCCSSPETEELNFPEFIEALVRCSCKLRWGEFDGGSHSNKTNGDDTVVVIKFVMLIFAMEGQGSVLKKRNEDVSAILGFLGQQQKKKQGEKLFRFRKMLADNKRRTRDTRNRQSPSVWNQVRLQFSPRASVKSPTRSHDTFDELTESWDGGSPRRVPTELFVFDAQTNEPFGLESPASRSVEEMSDRSDCPSQREEHGPSSLDNNRNDDSRQLAAGETQPTHTENVIDTVNQAGLLSTACAEPVKQDVATDDDRSAHTENSVTRSVGADLLTVSAVGATQTTVEGEELRSAGLVEPLEKDEFLRDILNSIGDVELLLSQSQFRGSSYSRQGKRNPQVTHASHPIESTAVTPSLTDLAGDRLTFNSNDSHTLKTTYAVSEGEGSHEDVQVRDPMLDYLTDIERFTESPDQDSLLSIADMTVIPFDEAEDRNCQSAAWTRQEGLSTAEVAGNATSQSAIHDGEAEGNTIK